MIKRFSLIALAVAIVLSGALVVVAQDAQPVQVGPIPGYYWLVGKFGS